MDLSFASGNLSCRFYCTLQLLDLRFESCSWTLSVVYQLVFDAFASLVLLLQLVSCIDDLLQAGNFPAQKKTRTTTATMPTEGYYLTPSAELDCLHSQILVLDSWPPETRKRSYKGKDNEQRRVDYRRRRSQKLCWTTSLR